jgi:transcriptional antiterminator NusG
MSDKLDRAQEDDIGVENTDLDEDNQDSEGETETQAVTKMENIKPAGVALVPAALQGKDKQASDSKFFAIRTTGGQERVVASQIQVRVNAKRIGIRSVMVLDSFKGYIIVEAPDSNVAYEALAGIRHVRGQIRGDLPFKDIEGYLVKKPVVSELNIDDTVEVIAGPFKSMKAKITRVDYEKQEATVVLLDSPYQIPVTVDANYLKKITH